MSTQFHKKVSDAITADSHILNLVAKGNIEVCIWGNKTVSEASERINGTQESSITGMTGFSEIGNSVLLKFDKCELDFIIDHIINTHHRYAKKNAIVVYFLPQTYFSSKVVHFGFFAYN